MSLIDELIYEVRAAGTAKASEEIDHVTGSIRKSDETAKKATKSHAGLGTAFGGLRNMVSGVAGNLGFAGLAFGIGSAISKATQFQATQAQLGNAIRRNVHAPAKDATVQMSDYADALATHGGFDPTQSIAGMTMLVRATGSVTKSEKDLSLATDIARGGHMNLARATKAVAMVEQGRTTGLGRMGIVLPKVTTAEDALKSAHVKATVAQKAQAKQLDVTATKMQDLRILTRRFGGDTSTYSHTAAGALSNVRNSVEQLGVKFGTALLPMVVAVAGVLGTLIGPLGKILGLIGPLTPLILAMAAAWGVYKVQMLVSAAASAVMNTALIANTISATANMGVTGGLTAAWAELNLVMAANPVLIVVLALGALIGVLILAYKHVAWFRNAVNATWKWLRTATVAVFGAVVGAIDATIKWVSRHWPLMLAILTGPIGLATLFIVRHFGSIKSAISDSVNWVVKEFNRMIAFLGSLPSKVGNAIKRIPVIGKALGVGGSIVGGISHGVGSVAHGIGSVLGGLQGGGEVHRSGPYLVGERGPEVVTLPRGASVTPNARNQGSGGGGNVEHVTVIYNILDGKKLSQSVIRQGLLQQSRGG